MSRDRDSREGRRVRATAVIVTYESTATVPELLACLCRPCAEGWLETFVVDNASRDGTADLVRGTFPWVRLIANDDNLGFGRACNQGLAGAAGQYVVFLNADTRLPADALVTLLEFMDEHPTAGVAAPATRTRDGFLQFAGGLPTPIGILRSAAGREPHPERRSIEPNEPPFETNWLCGAILVARNEMLRQLGGFDDRFFLYFEETDLCKRARDLGWSLWAVGTAVAFHEVGHSVGSTRGRLRHGDLSEHFYRSRFYYLCKHHGRWVATLTEVAELAILGVLAIPRWLRRRDSGGFRERLRAPILSQPDVST